MVTASALGFGSTITWNAATPAELTKIGGIKISGKKVDVTNFDSPDDFREYLIGLFETDDIPLEGNYIPGDTAQAAMLTDFLARTTRAVVITLPATIGTVTCSFNAKLTNWEIGDLEDEKAVSWKATINVIGKPAISVGASTGLTTPFFTVTGSGGAGVIAPVAAGAVYSYIVTLVGGSTWYTITPTATAGTITITDGNGGSQVVLTGVASTQITAPTNGFHDTVISVKEAGKTAKNYTLHVLEPV